MLIVWLIILIVGVVIGIWTLLYFVIKRSYHTKYLKKGGTVLDSRNAFTYKNIIASIGGLENIRDINSDGPVCVLELLSVGLIDEKWAQNLGLKLSINDSNVRLEVKGFNFKTFVLKTQRAIKSISS
ncbi:hypothetical protein SSABA_v1c07890 [Spiroplasma sabaudiense Ar-1343]|uniref:PTS EIIB type-1 domain-containing protein n=1 Tax=Spiroplasma sabaudiense Ar-1343 TaxID=1276257 RepID=W6AB33_9MOLU|nr:hypothetical protein [Spiroplasma sabaudiense]AHI54191.1 hypothetical protein SSABA_v1c07890 [Spiroplasma sabaudiense Ar-1343]